MSLFIDIINKLSFKKTCILRASEFFYLNHAASLSDLEIYEHFGFQPSSYKLARYFDQVFLAKKELLDKKASLIIPEPFIYAKLLGVELKLAASSHFVCFKDEYAYIASFKKGKLCDFLELPASSKKQLLLETAIFELREILASLKGSVYTINEPCKLDNTISLKYINDSFEYQLLKRCKDDFANLSIKKKEDKKRIYYLASSLLFSTFLSFFYYLYLCFDAVKLDERYADLNNKYEERKSKILAEEKEKNIILNTKAKEEENIAKLQEKIYKKQKELENTRRLSGGELLYEDFYKIISLLNKNQLRINAFSLDEASLKLNLDKKDMDTFISKIHNKTQFILDEELVNEGVLNLSFRRKNAYKASFAS